MGERVNKELFADYFQRATIRDVEDSFLEIKRFIDRGVVTLDTHNLRSMSTQAAQLSAAINRLIGFEEAKR